MSARLRIATRGSKLALWQAEHVRALLLKEEPRLDVELVVLKTMGDRVQDRPLQDLGGKGLFTKEIEEALLDGRAQLAVHSMKDLPAEGPEGLCIGAVPRREDPRDALLLRPGLRAAPSAKDGSQGAQLPAPAGRGAGGEGTGLGLELLPTGACVGTTSLRRASLLRRLRDDLRIEPLRGNVDTRLARLEAGDLDAIILAVAGLSRLGHGARIDRILPADLFVPAVGQGALALQCRQDDEGTLARVQRLEDRAARVTTDAERAFLRRLEGSCKTPLGAHATLAGQRLTLDGFLVKEEGGAFHRAQLEGPAEDAAALGRALAEQVLAMA